MRASHCVPLRWSAGTSALVTSIKLAIGKKMLTLYSIAVVERQSIHNDRTYRGEFHGSLQHAVADTQERYVVLRSFYWSVFTVVRLPVPKKRMLTDGNDLPRRENRYFSKLKILCTQPKRLTLRGFCIVAKLVRNQLLIAIMQLRQTAITSRR
jgi:hypothetical protein